MRFKNLTGLLILLAGFVVITACFVILSPIVFFCAKPSARHPQEVNAAPLVNVIIPDNIENISDIINLELFDRVEELAVEDADFVKGYWLDSVESNYREFAGITVEFALFPELEYAQGYYENMCDLRGTPFEYSEEYSYCVSYATEDRLPPDSFCRPTGHYYSLVAFQKGRLVIIINEMSSNVSSSKKDEVIALLSQEIRKKTSVRP